MFTLYFVKYNVLFYFEMLKSYFNAREIRLVFVCSVIKTDAEIFENFSTGEMKNVSDVGQRVICAGHVMGHIYEVM